ncbi:MAG: hypothetical protein ACLQGP_35140 [Isosphaeraceae bacterium]
MTRQRLDGMLLAEVVRRLEIKVATAFVALSKVERMIREEVARLEQDAPPVPSTRKREM